MAGEPQGREEEGAGPNWADIRRMFNQVALERGEYAGIPMIVHDTRLAVAPRHRNYEGWNGGTLGPDPAAAPSQRVCGGGVDKTEVIRNSWWSRRLQSEVFVYATGPVGHRSIHAAYEPYSAQLAALRRWGMDFDTLKVANRAWDETAELNAMVKLREHITVQQWRTYVLTGAFLESSKRSQARYQFRKGRPTLVLLPTGKGDAVGPSVALCMHPLAYYEGTFAGGMCPTDDVIAHLLLMRADEAAYWRRCNQHPIDRMNAGV